MAVTDTRPAVEADAVDDTSRRAPGVPERLLGGADHTTIGRLFIVTGLAFFCVAIIARLIVGIDQLTDNGLLGSWLTMVSSSARVFGPLSLVALILGVLVVLVPLQLASPSIAYPRALALSYWSWMLSSLVFAVSVGFDGGIGGSNTEAARLGSLSMGLMLVSLALTAVCVATTVMTHRPEGMGLSKVPFLSWSALLGSTLWIVTVGSAFAHVVAGQVAQADASALAENFLNGIAWMTRAPAVYVMVIPVLGIAIDLVSSATGARVKQYGVAQALLAMFAILSFGAWAQLDRSVNTLLWTLFALGIGLPVLGVLGLIGDLVRRGSAKVTPALGLAVVSLLLILGSVLAGLLWSLDQAGVGTLFGFNLRLLGAAQVTFVGASVLTGSLAAIFHWAPKIWGAGVPTGAAGTSALLVAAGGGLLATVVLVQGLVQRNESTTATPFFGALTALAALLYLFGALGALVAFRSSIAASDAGYTDDARRGATLEWAFASPAHADRVPESLPAVTSPYPLGDESSASGDGEVA